MTYRIPSRLAHSTHEIGPRPDGGVELDVYVRPLPGGPTMVLTGVGALIWLVAADGALDVAASVADVVGKHVKTVRFQVEDHVDLLVAQGLLEPVGRLGASTRSHP